MGGTVNSNWQPGLAAMNSVNGFFLNWNPTVPVGAGEMCLGGGYLAVTGTKFVYPSGEARPHLAVFPTQ